MIIEEKAIFECPKVGTFGDFRQKCPSSSMPMFEYAIFGGNLENSNFEDFEHPAMLDIINN